MLSLKTITQNLSQHQCGYFIFPMICVVQYIKINKVMYKRKEKMLRIFPPIFIYTKYIYILQYGYIYIVCIMFEYVHSYSS